MPRNKYPDHPVRDEFLAKLRAFYTDCGSPRYRLIVTMSQRLNELYPNPHRWDSLPTFSPSALSETLNGHRRALPEPGWVTSFVLCCQRIAYETGHLPSDPGRSSLDHWQTLLRQAEAESERLGLPGRPGPRGRAGTPAAGRSGAVTGRPRPATDPAVLFGDPAAAEDGTVGGFSATGPILLGEPQFEYVAAYGPYGRSLLERLHGRQPHAAYQIGVLLAADPGRGDHVLSVLTDAATTGHPGALALLQASPGVLDRRQTAEHARALARLAADAGFTTAAAAFRECAARHLAGQATGWVDSDLGSLPASSPGSGTV